MSNVRVKIQTQDFDIGEEYQRVSESAQGAGAVVLFTGLVREFNAQGGVEGIILEHYPEMTEKSLRLIVEKALQRWSLMTVTVIHRVGRLNSFDQIVLVAVAAKHRAEAFAASEYIMDYLKTEAPFWKQEVSSTGESTWVEAKVSDQRARERW